MTGIAVVTSTCHNAGNCSTSPRQITISGVSESNPAPNIDIAYW